MFNIQPDSPTHIIKTSYLTLSKDSNAPKDLLDLAYTILSNPDKRKLYDKLLSKHSHGYALGKLTSSPQEIIIKEQYTDGTLSTILKKTSAVKIKTTHINSKQGKSNNAYYQPVITQYCFFCKTPHNQSPCKHTAALCNDCKSPLFPPSDVFLEQQRRDIIRMAKDHDINFYTFWPGEKLNGIISDISPTGMQLLSTTSLNKDQIIKLDGEDFKAIGIVSYSKNNIDKESKVETCRIQFLTVNFNKRKGQFLSESA